jgi:DNA-binding protein HU-beta
MKKSGLVEAMMTATGMNKKDSTLAVDTLFDTIIKTMSKGEDVVISGFGTFKVYKRAERIGRNPATGEQIKIAAAIKPKFRAGKLLKEAVR